MQLVEETGRIMDPQLAADAAGLRYVTADARGITRKRAGTGFSYADTGGKTIHDRVVLDRIHKLAIPPAWTQVWICPQANGHLQATGLDARGRKQYRYNDEFRALRETAKFEHILVFAQALPTIRERIAKDMGRHGVPREKVNTSLLQHLDWPGLVYSGFGFALLYAGLDQGNRLDWNNNGLVNGILLSGGLLTVAFVVRELTAEKPFLNLRLLAREGLVPILLLVTGFRFIILSTAYIIPTYLQVVQNYRELQVGAVLLWIALPQLLIVLPLGWLLSRVDARWVLAVGAILIGIASLMGTGLTQDWATDDFLPSQVLQAVGQSFALTAVVVLAVQSMSPADVLTIGTLLQTSRLFGGEIGTAFMQTFVRVREQVHSNLIGLHVDSLGGQTADRLAAYRNAVAAHSSDAAHAIAQGTSLLGSAVAKQAAVLSYIDGFLAAAIGAYACLVLTAFLRRH